MYAEFKSYRTIDQSTNMHFLVIRSSTDACPVKVQKLDFCYKLPVVGSQGARKWSNCMLFIHCFKVRESLHF